jgi:hypothetical protein
LAEKTALAATVRLAVEGPAVRAKIDSLQSELAKLEKAAADATKETEMRVLAIAQLADVTLLPEPSRSRYRFGRERWEKNYGIPARTKRQEAAGCEEKSRWTVADREKIAVYCQGHKDPAVREIVGVRFDQPHATQVNGGDADVRDRRFVAVNPAAWSAHAAALHQQAEQKLQQAEQLERDGESLKKEIDQMLAKLIPA